MNNLKLFWGIALLLLTCWANANPIDSIKDQPSSAISKTYYKTLRSSDVKAYKLNRYGRDYGYAVWMHRKNNRVRATYFANRQSYTSAYSRYQSWKKGEDIILACSGAYSNGFDNTVSNPVGLTIESGKIINRNIDRKMDGLVIVYATGGIAVANIDEGVYLKSLGKRVYPRYQTATFTNWARQEKATVFQTHLLAYKNKLQILPKAKDKDNPTLRRVLVLAENSRGEVIHIIFDVQKKVYLYDTASDIFDHMKAENMEVVAMLNLDAGGHDAINVFDNKGLRDKNIKGTTSLTGSVNLIVYRYE